MSANLIRNTVTLLFVLTLANLAASFAALYAVRTIRDDAQQKLARIEQTTEYLGAAVAQLCQANPVTCPPAPAPIAAR